MTRNYKIASRTSYYNPPLINKLGMITERGHRAYEWCKVVREELHPFYREYLPNPECVELAPDMCMMVINASMPVTTMSFLRVLYALQYEPHNLPHTTNTLSLFNDPDEKFQRTIYDKTYLLGEYFRTYRHLRGSCDELIKYGLAE